MVLTASPCRAGNGSGKRLEIRVDDDGPGLTDEQRAELIKRGLRLDETKPGSGLGLSIVADLAQSYSGKLELARPSTAAVGQTHLAARHLTGLRLGTRTVGKPHFCPESAASLGQRGIDRRVARAGSDGAKDGRLA